ncbi:MAG: inosine/xanthosine triphosphatase [Candidatus Micrarchaeota archaeon]|nr:inosine/xanthosine triphosphatase [Candidatus Micrarchaeota archaeon]
MGRHCIIGGTFTYVHSGHLRLLSECGKFSRITVGLTSDSYVRSHKLYPSFPYRRRLAGLRAALKKLGILSRCRIVQIEDEFGGADENMEADAIVVSEETASVAERINARRIKRRLLPLEIIRLPLLYGEDLKKISCAAIYEGRTDLCGRLLLPLRLQLATDNPTKRQGAERAIKRIFGGKFAIFHHSEKSGVPAHPFDGQTFRGAENRAKAAWKRAKGKCDYAIGIESGLFSRLKRGLHIDITVACVYDGEEATYGTGMGFAVPNAIAEKIKRDSSDLSEALRQLTGIEKIGWKQGALGWFSHGRMHRSEQVEAAVCCAFVPRIARAKLAVKY